MTETPGTGPVWSGEPPVTGTPVSDRAELAEHHEEQALRRRRIRPLAATVLAAAVAGGIAATAIQASGSDRGSSHTASTALGGFDSRTQATGASAGTDGTARATAPGAGASPSGDASTPAGATTPAGAASAADASRSATPALSAATRPATPGEGVPAAAATATDTSAAAPPPPAPSSSPKDPLTLISDVRTDGAPLDPAGLFSATTLPADGRTWTRIALASTTACWQATIGGLGDVLVGQNCRGVLRATYTSGNSVVTIGVAVFDTKAQADTVQKAAKGQLQGLVPAGTISFCSTAGCVNSHDSIGRYTYYSVSGTLRPGGTTADATSSAAGPQLAAYASSRLLARAQEAAG